MQINVIQFMEFLQQNTKPVFFKRTGCLLENEKKNLCTLMVSFKRTVFFSTTVTVLKKYFTFNRNHRVYLPLIFS